jgi:hypothetical protein
MSNKQDITVSLKSRMRRLFHNLGSATCGKNRIQRRYLQGRTLTAAIDTSSSTQWPAVLTILLLARPNFVSDNFMLLYEIAAVKNGMRQWLERENRDSATQGGTGDEPENNERRQGETPEVPPHGSALPP